LRISHICIWSWLATGSGAPGWQTFIC
jgi:hypothetical protein